jgi:hypothetical protein
MMDGPWRKSAGEPARIGFLTDASSDQLRAEAEGLRTPGAGVEIVALASPRRACEILVLPFDLRRSTSTIIQGEAGLLADVVVVIGSSPDEAAKTAGSVATLKAQTGAEAAAVASIPEAERARWVAALAANIEAGESIDRAIALACSEVGAQPPVLSPAAGAA